MNNPHFCEVGDVLRFKKGDRLYRYPKTDREITTEITLKRPRCFLVVRAELEGGGTGMGPHDIYPDGWHLHLLPVSNGKVKETGPKFGCYQSGCFTIVHEKIEKVGKMKIKWVPA